MNKITVLLADDHAIVRDALRVLLEAAKDIQVVGEAENGQQAVREAARLRPDVALLDISMPLLNGVEAARQITQASPRTRVLILSAYNDDHHLQQAVAAGVAGYLMKETAGHDLLQAVRATRNGEASFSPPLFKRLLKQWNGGPAGASRPPANEDALSWRQMEVLQLIAEGYATKQIAGLLCIAVKTAEKHRQGLMDKLNVHKIAALTSYALEHGVIESSRIPGWPSNLPAATPEREKRSSAGERNGSSHRFKLSPA